MKINMKNLPEYELIDERDLTDIHSQGIYLRHKKSGARVAVISNDDPNKVFYIGFRTPSRDSAGVPHIIEHTVLCGSEKFPVKDPFIELVKGSMNTFLNAMTYPDKTVYPVASTNDKDFQNLMDVYMDAVLHPNIYKEENIFKQEGWHYELDSPEDDLTINGVVYNEMKGAFSMDAAEKLNWLDEEYLSAYDEIDPDSNIQSQPAFEAPLSYEKYYSISSGDSEENGAYLSCNWCVGDGPDALEYVAWDILSYALIDSQGAPLKEALTEAGIGDDIYGGYDGGVRQPYFSVIAKNANESDRERFCSIIKKVLTELAGGGLNHATLLAAINGAEFKFREADFGRIPKGLMFGLQMLDSWLYDDSEPFLHMDELSVYDELRNRLEQGYFEGMIEKYLIDNPHTTQITLLPKKGLNAEKDEALAVRLKACKDYLNEDEINELIRQTKALEDYQTEPSLPEDLEKIPMLSRADMKKDSMPYSNIIEKCEGVDFIWHDYETNGIIYLDYLFDVGHISEEMVPYLQILKTLMGSLDTEDYSYVDLANEVNLYTGGVAPSVSVFGDMSGKRAYQPKFEIRIRTLSKNLDKAVSLAKSMMLDTSFDDEKRIYDVLAEMRSRLLTNIRESGNTAASLKAMSAVSAKSRYDDLLHGIGQYRAADALVDDFENVKDDLISVLTGLVKSIFTRERLMVSVTCRKPEYELVKARAAELTEGLPRDTGKAYEEIPPAGEISEGYMDASQIHYVVLGGSYKETGLPYTGALSVFRCIMNYEYLWQNIRVLGGAYGCGCSIDRCGNICFSSYRDPNLGGTLDVYRGVADYLRNFDVSDRDMTRYVIGAFSEADAPLTPVSLGRRSLTGYITGIDLAALQKARDEMLNCNQQDIRDLAAYVEAALKAAGCCVIGNEESIRENEALFKHVEVL